MQAYSCYLEAVRIQPTFAIAWSNLAGLFMESGDLNRALQYYKEAVKLKPAFPDAYFNLGNVYKVRLYSEKSSLQQCFLENIKKRKFFQSFVYKALGRPTEAIMCYQHAIQARPSFAMAFGEFILIQL